MDLVFGKLKQCCVSLVPRRELESENVLVSAAVVIDIEIEPVDTLSCLISVGAVSYPD